MAEKSTQQDKIIDDANLFRAFRLMKAKDYTQAEALINEGITKAHQENNVELEGLYYSALGVLYKLKKNYNKAYGAYQKAERLLPDDHSLKIVSATLLIEQFKQYSTAARKMDKVIASTEDPALWHHAKATQAVAYYLMGKKAEAGANFNEMLKQDFNLLRFAANVDFKTAELFVQKKFMPDECRQYLQKALLLAKSKKEKTFIVIIENLLKVV
ncbi:MAG: hypothetical protein HQM16_03830 [Deltaproteobacteria bacterium]|nr:hypothetical protein [Deltaproteobacteria bacterium]